MATPRPAGTAAGPRRRAAPRGTVDSGGDALGLLRQWWADNGKMASAGFVVAAVLVGGWQGWGYYRDGHFLEAAEHYESFAELLESYESDEAGLVFPELPSGDYADTPYPAFARLLRAEYLVGRDELALAAEDLRWVAENAVQPVVSELAYVRLARVLIALDKVEEGLEILEGRQFSAAGAALVEETRGDALLKLNNVAAAGAAYEAAWKATRNKPDFLRLKLQALGRAPGMTTQESPRPSPSAP